MKNLTPPQAEILRLLCTGTGKYAYRNVSDDLVWETGEPKSGYFAQGIDFEPLCGLKEIGEWRINSLRPASAKIAERGPLPKIEAALNPAAEGGLTKAAYSPMLCTDLQVGALTKGAAGKPRVTTPWLSLYS